MENWKVGRSHLSGNGDNWFADGSKNREGARPLRSSTNRDCRYTLIRMQSAGLWPRTLDESAIFCINKNYVKIQYVTTLKKKIRRYRHNCGSLTYIILEIYRKPRFACINSACVCIPTIWITIAAIFLVNCQLYFVELLKNIQLYLYGW